MSQSVLSYASADRDRVKRHAPEKAGGGDNLFRADGRPCIEACKAVGLPWTKEWSGRPANTCTCDFP